MIFAPYYTFVALTFYRFRKNRVWEQFILWLKYRYRLEKNSIFGSYSQGLNPYSSTSKISLSFRTRGYEKSVSLESASLVCLVFAALNSLESDKLPNRTSAKTFINYWSILWKEFGDFKSYDIFSLKKHWRFSFWENHDYYYSQGMLAESEALSEEFAGDCSPSEQIWKR
jgi:hypothetical protein